MIDVTSLLFLGIAVVVLWRLYTVLGTKSGSNGRPPSEPFLRRDGTPPNPGEDNVIRLPGTVRSVRQEAPPADAAAPAPDQATVGDAIDRMVPAGTALNEALRTIASADKSFDPAHFMSGARAAYEMVVVAFAAADRATLKMLLSPEVCAGFSEAIDARQAKGETLSTRFIGLDRCEIIEAALKNGLCHITVRFVSKLISVTTASDGTVVSGDAQKVLDVTDLWTFARDVRSKDPNWKLVATGVDG